jgi:hypothetical protein
MSIQSLIKLKSARHYIYINNRLPVSRDRMTIASLGRHKSARHKLYINNGGLADRHSGL